MISPRRHAQYRGSFEAGLYVLAACALLSGIIAYIAVQPTARTAEQGGLATPAA